MAEAAAATAASEAMAGEARLEMERAVQGETELRMENNQFREDAAVFRGQLEAKGGRMAELSASLGEAQARAEEAHARIELIEAEAMAARQEIHAAHADALAHGEKEAEARVEAERARMETLATSHEAALRQQEREARDTTQHSLEQIREAAESEKGLLSAKVDEVQVRHAGEKARWEEEKKGLEQQLRLALEANHKMELDFNQRLCGLKGDLTLEGLKNSQHVAESHRLAGQLKEHEEARRELETHLIEERERAQVSQPLPVREV